MASCHFFYGWAVFHCMYICLFGPQKNWIIIHQFTHHCHHPVILLMFKVYNFYKFWYMYISVQFSHSVMSDPLQPHESQHTRPPCPSPTPRVYPNPCPSSWWCHPAISSSVIPFSYCPQSFPASGSFPMSQLFAWGVQSIRVSASTSVLPMNTQDWSPLVWTGWISLQSKGFSRVFSNTTYMYIYTDVYIYITTIKIN